MHPVIFYCDNMICELRQVIGNQIIVVWAMCYMSCIGQLYALVGVYFVIYVKVYYLVQLVCSDNSDMYYHTPQFHTGYEDEQKQNRSYA